MGWYDIRIIKPMEIIEVHVNEIFDLVQKTKYKKWKSPYMLYSYKSLKANNNFWDSKLNLIHLGGTEYKYVSETNDISNDSIISILIMESNDIQNNVFKNQQKKSMSWKTYFTLNKNKHNNYVIYENIPLSNNIYDTIATFNLPQEWFIWDNEMQNYIAPNVKYFIMLNELFIPKGTTEINFDIGFPTVETMPERIIAYTNNIYDNSDTTYYSKSVFGSGLLKLQPFDIPSNTYAFSVVCHVAGRDNFRPNILIKADDRHNGELIRFNSQELDGYIKNSYYSKNINIEKNAKQIFIEIQQDAPRNTLINATVTFYIRKYNPPEFSNGENSLTGLCNILCLKEN